MKGEPRREQRKARRGSPDPPGASAVLAGMEQSFHRRSSGWARPALAVLAVLALGCGDTGTSPEGNRAPRPIGLIAPDTVVVGGSARIDVAAYFSDPDGDPLTYGVASSDTRVTVATVAGRTVTVAGVAAGNASVTVTATDPGGLTATQSFAVTVDAVVVAAAEVFQSLLANFAGQNDIGAAAMGVMKDGEIVYDGAVGFMDGDRQGPIAPDVMMRIASVSKPVTAAAIRALAAARRLDFGDRAFDLGQEGGGILDIEPFPWQGDSRLADITVIHLLRHQGGWDREETEDFVFRELRIAEAMSIPSPPGRVNTVRYVLGQPLQFAPGARSAYSNVGYLVLGLIIEEVSGQDYMTYVRESVFAPLGVPPEDVIRGRTFPEDRSGREPWYAAAGTAVNVFDPTGPRVRWPDGGWDHEAKVAEGGLVLTTRALLRFADSHRLWGDDIGRPRSHSEGAGRWAYHTGSLSGTNTLAHQRGNGITYVALFNRRPAGQPDYAERFRSVVETRLNGLIEWPRQVVTAAGRRPRH